MLFRSVAASNPYPLPTPVYRPAMSLEHPENAEAQTEAGLADAETVAKSFGQVLLRFYHLYYFLLHLC